MKGQSVKNSRYGAKMQPDHFSVPNVFGFDTQSLLYNTQKTLSVCGDRSLGQNKNKN